MTAQIINNKAPIIDATIFNIILLSHVNGRSVAMHNIICNNSTCLIADKIWDVS